MCISIDFHRICSMSESLQFYVAAILLPGTNCFISTAPQCMDHNYGLGMNYIWCPGIMDWIEKNKQYYLRTKSHTVYNLLRIIQCCCFCCCLGSEIGYNQITNYWPSSVSPKGGIFGKIYKNNEMCRINFYL